MNILNVTNITKKLIEMGVKPDIKLSDYDRIVSTRGHTLKKCDLEDYIGIFVSEKDR